MDLKSLKMPSNVRAVCTYNPMMDAYHINLSWRFLEQKYGCTQMVTSQMSMDHWVKVVFAKMFSEGASICNFDEKQSKSFQMQVASVFEKLLNATLAGKTNICIEGAHVKWATGNVVAKSLQAGHAETAQQVLLNGIALSPSVSEMARKLPGVEYQTFCPDDECFTESTVYYLIQHLNDDHKWTREKIADWIDELHDAGKINAEFQPWDDDSPKAQESLQQSTTPESVPLKGPLVSMSWDDEAAKFVDMAQGLPLSVKQTDGTTKKLIGFSTDATINEEQGWVSVGYTTKPAEVNWTITKETNDADEDQD